MSKLDVIKYFKDKNFEVNIIELKDSSTVVKAAEALGIKTNEIAKSLAFKVNDEVVIIVTSGDARIDNKKFKDYFNAKGSMLPFEEVEKTTGHPVGGVCPFGLRNDLKIYLDESLKGLEYVYPAAGETNCALKINVSDLVSLTNGTWIDVCIMR